VISRIGTLLLALGCMLPAAAQELEPRSYANAPPGLNFVVAGYTYSDGSVASDPSLPLENAKIDVQGPVLGYARSLAIAGDAAQVAVSIANVCLDGSADFNGQHYTRNVCGWTDAKLRLTWNFLGAPSMGLREFAAWKQDLLVGASLTVNLPVGDYDPERLVNIGTNRWAAKGEIGVSKAVGRWIFEGSAAGFFFETNNEFFGGKTREQDPVYSLQAHVIYGFKSGIWLAANTTFYRGGRTRIDGVEKYDLQSNSRTGVTASFPLTRRQSIKVAASTGVSTRTGSDFDTATAVWQYRFGAGL